MENSVRRDWLYQLAVALAFLISLVMVNANVESGMNDDWSFIFTARDLAATGHLHYNGWSAPLIGFQAYWAALFLKVFGFSFFTARASTWILAMLAIPVLWRILRIVELSQKQALFGMLFFLLSPLVLPHLATFMTDLPAFFLCAAALLCALQAWNASADHNALVWAAAAACCGFLSGSVRQIYWLSAVCFLSVLAFKRLRSVRGRACLLICILLTMIGGALASHWLAQQPYVPADDTLQQLKQVSTDDLMQAAADVVRAFVGIAVLCIPLTLPFIRAEMRRTSLWLQSLIVAAALILPHFLASPMPWLGNTLTNYGVIVSGGVSLGEKPAILPDLFMKLLATVGMAGLAYTLINIFRHRRDWLSGGSARFLLLIAPFLLFYSLVIAGRSPAQGIYDRYLIPHLFVATVLLLAAHARQGRSIGILILSTGAVFWLYSLATTHDYFAEARARLKATEEVLHAGNTPSSILSGLAFDSWSQIERSGYVNNEKLRFPAHAYRQIGDCNGPEDTLEWWRSMETNLAARYVVTLTPLSGLRRAAFPPVEYWRWLPLGRYQVLVETVEDGSPVLTCKPDTGT